MKRFLRLTVIICIACLLFFFPRHVFAVEDPTVRPNNKFGIHILFPSEIEMAARLVNSNGGDWGYLTIPIQSTDRNLEKWQKFMDDARRLHVVPIIRIATYPESNFWTKPTIFDHVDFANFLNSLTWPTKNRYIIAYNEPNSSLEWGGAVDATSYAQELLYTIEAFKRANEDFFIISAGLDSYAPNRGTLYQNSYRFLRDMDEAVPGIFGSIDGFASHSYPSREFRTDPTLERSGGIFTYREEQAFLARIFGRANIPIFITETGWQVDEASTAQYYRYAFERIWLEQNIVAVTPFLLDGRGSNFKNFSLIRANGSTSSVFETISQLAKTRGDPYLTPPVGSAIALQDSPTYLKNFEHEVVIPHTITVSQPVRNFFKWLLKI